MQSNGQNDHPHIQGDPFTPHPQPTRPPISQEDNNPIPIEIDDNSVDTAATTTATMPTFEELTALAAAQ